nr:MAG TPA_asm: hypothetical protein [Caudoviricetes sp.]
MKKNNNTEKAVLDAQNISESLKKGTESVFQSLINDTLNKLITESEDDDAEEVEVEDTDAEKDTKNEGGVEKEPKNGDGEEADADNEADGAEEDDTDLDDFEIGDGVYDVTDADDETALKVYNKLNDDDEIVVTDNGDGSYEFEGDDGQEYVIELPEDFGDNSTEDVEFEIEPDGDDDADDSVEFEFDPDEDEDDIDIEFDDNDGDDEFEIDDDDDDLDIELVDDDDDALNEENLGYTDSYQHDVMPGFNNDEPANPRATYSMDGGAPKGASKPWAGKGNSKPFNGESDIEENITTSKASARKMVKTNINGNGYEPQVTKVNSANGQYIKESIKKLQKENKQYRLAINGIKKSLKEAAVLNVSLGQIVKLLSENSTTKAEKKSIVERFTNVKTIAEGKQLYNSISRELNEAKKSPISIEKTFSTKSSKALNETTIYNKSTEDNPALDLMNRMNNLYK